MPIPCELFPRPFGIFLCGNVGTIWKKATEARLLRGLRLDAQRHERIEAQRDEVRAELVDGLVIAAKALCDRDFVLLRRDLGERHVQRLLHRRVVAVGAHDDDALARAEDLAQLCVVNARLRSSVSNYTRFTFL